MDEFVKTRGEAVGAMKTILGMMNDEDKAKAIAIYEQIKEIVKDAGDAGEMAILLVVAEIAPEF